MKILIAGDFCPRGRVAPLVEAGDIQAVFDDVTDVVRTVNYAIVNYECPVVKTSVSPITKVGPNLSSSASGVKILQKAGFHCLTLANNHIMDYGVKGLQETMNLCSQQGLDTVGVGRDHEEAGKILYVEIEDKKLALINCCETEFSIAKGSHAGANQLDAVAQFNAIQEASHSADYVVVIVHGGHEHWQLPSPRMVDLYRFFIAAGADAVINHHQHCYSGYEIYKGKPIFYGLGNFCMDKSPIRISQPWNYGYMVRLTLEDEKVSFDIIPYVQCGERPGVHLLDKNAFDEQFAHLNAIIVSRTRLEEATLAYYDECKKQIENVLNPIQNRYVRKLQKMGILPSLLTKNWLLFLKDFLFCESHRDKVEHYINKTLCQQ